MHLFLWKGGRQIRSKILPTLHVKTVKSQDTLSSSSWADMVTCTIDFQMTSVHFCAAFMLCNISHVRSNRLLVASQPFVVPVHLVFARSSPGLQHQTCSHRKAKQAAPKTAPSSFAVGLARSYQCWNKMVLCDIFWWRFGLLSFLQHQSLSQMHRR